MEKENKKKLKKHLLVIVPLILLLFIISLILLESNVKSDTKEISNKDVSGIQINIGNNDSVPNQRKTRILGDNNNSLDKDNRYLYLPNDESNHVFFQFEIVENGKSIYSSDLIEPGKMEKIDAVSLLSKGEHNLEYQITTYDLESKEIRLSGVKQIKKIVIE